MLSIVVPCYCEESVLGATFDRLWAVASQAGEAFEIIFVDDGSTDRTWSLISAWTEKDASVRGIRLSRNFGHQAALSAGLSFARGQQILIIDADLQDPPELLSLMRQKMAEGFDVVYGQRRRRAGESFFKRYSAFCFYRFLGWLSDIEIPPDTGDFRLLSRRALDAFLTLPESSRFIRGMVAWIGFPQCAVLYDRERRLAGKTKYTFSRMVQLSLNAMAGFSVRPLRVAGLAAALLVLLAIALIVWAVITRFQNDTVRGWTSLIVTVLLVGGVQTFLLGVIGEYIGHIFREVKRRPLYIIQEQTSGPK